MVARDGNLERAVAELVEEIMARALQEARQELDAAPTPADGAPSEEQQREIDLLRRRVAKLTESLGVTEQELDRVRGIKGPEEGVASIYREVQGLSDEDAQALEEELTYLLVNQMVSFNSPVWFNCGVEERPQVSACFINSVQDTMDSIKAYYDEVVEWHMREIIAKLDNV